MASALAPILSAALLRELLHYDSETGVFCWRVEPCYRCPVGSVAGYIDDKGYRIIKVRGRHYKAHRLAWLYVHGDWPPDQIDHINLEKADNRIANLRPATNGQNSHNRRSFGSRSGLKGAHWNGKLGKWQGRITINGEPIYLGIFSDPAEAHAAYCRVATERLGQYARGA